jgi:hypothetical protein
MKGTTKNANRVVRAKKRIEERARKIAQANGGHGNGSIHRKVKLPARPVAVSAKVENAVTAGSYPAVTGVAAESTQQLTHLVQVLRKENAAFMERLRMFTPVEWKARERERKLEAAIAKSADDLSD